MTHIQKLFYKTEVLGRTRQTLLLKASLHHIEHDCPCLDAIRYRAKNYLHLPSVPNMVKVDIACIENQQRL